MRKWTVIVASLLYLVSAAAVPAQTTSVANVAWFNGYCQPGIPGMANWYSTSQSYSRVFDNFVVPAGGWKVTGLFSMNAASVTGITQAVWEIRSGVASGNGGTIVASGTNSAIEVTQTDSAGVASYRIVVDGLNVQLAAGSYWLSISPVVNYTPSGGSVPPSYVCPTHGADAVGNPAGNDGSAYFDSTATGAIFAPADSTGWGGFSGDFSFGVLSANGYPITLVASPAASSRVAWYNGACQQGIPGVANWYSGIQQFSRLYEDFAVPAGGWNVSGVFSLGPMSVQGVNTAAWEIRSGVSTGNAGTVVASGISPATQALVETWPDSETIYRLEVDGLGVQLAAGQYWLSVSPVVNYTPSGTPPSYVCTTRGLEAVGSPAGNDGDAYFDSLVVTGSNYVNIKSTGAAGVSGDYSLGVLIPTVPPLPSVPSIVTVANSASWQSGTVSPGELVSIFGAGLGPTTISTLALDPNGLVSAELDGVQVFFGSLAAPEIYVSGNQINAIVPYEAAGAGSLPVTVVSSGQVSNVLPVTVLDAVPAIFTADGSGAGQAAALNLDNTYNTPDHPAAKGSYVVLYLTGEGLTGAPQTGGVTTVAAQAPWTPQPMLQVTVDIAGQPAFVAFYGEAPNLVSGVMQVNVQIPLTVPSGNLPLTVSVGANRATGGVTISVQ